jgi:hypothetical protein
MAGHLLPTSSAQAFEAVGFGANVSKVQLISGSPGAGSGHESLPDERGLRPALGMSVRFPAALMSFRSTTVRFPPLKLKPFARRRTTANFRRHQRPHQDQFAQCHLTALSAAALGNKNGRRFAPPVLV